MTLQQWLESPWKTSSKGNRYKNHKGMNIGYMRGGDGFYRGWVGNRFLPLQYRSESEVQRSLWEAVK